VSRPLVLVEPKTHRRLKLVDALRGQRTVQPLTGIDGALRHIRTHRPRLVLIGVGRRIEPALRLARQIRTDGSTPAMVALIDWDGRISRPSESATACGAVGVFSGTPNAEEVVEFVASLSADELTLRGSPRQRPWDRWISR
jgi:DNA-binding NarL/FixJ family response regulator